MVVPQGQQVQVLLQLEVMVEAKDPQEGVVALLEVVEHRIQLCKEVPLW